MIPVEIMTHVPAVWTAPWRKLEPHPARDFFLQQERPMPISVRIPTPRTLLDLPEPRANLRRLELLARAVFAVLQDDRVEGRDCSRLFHQWLCDGELYESEGTTISVTSYDHGGAVIFGTLDADEPYTAVLGRLSEMRRIAKLPAMVARALLERSEGVRRLPPPQVVLSDVIPTGLEDGRTSLGGYGSGSEIPIVIAVMRQHMEVAFDHRIFNPPDEQRFAAGFSTNLENSLTLLRQ